MSRRKRRQQVLQREKEMLQSPVRMDGSGEHPLVAEYLRKFPQGGNAESAELALAMDRFLKGDLSLLDDPAQMEKLSKFRQSMAKRDDAERRWNEDKGRFAEDLFRKADKVRPSREKRDEVIARGMKIEQEALIAARANRSTKQLQLRWEMEHGPKREVYVTGVPISLGGKVIIEPEVINIMGITMILKPGKQLVPEVFAQRLEQRQNDRKEREAREAALGDNLRADQLAQRWSAIGEEFGSVSIGRESENELLRIPGQM